MSVEATDKEAAANATGPRVTLAFIEGEISHVAYMNGSTFVTRADQAEVRSKVLPLESVRTMTICAVTMKNGYMVIGKSAPAAPENYNEELGRKFAYEDCIRQLWPLLGYALRDQLNGKA